MIVVFLIGFLIFAVSIIGFFVSLFISAIKREYSDAPILWCIALNVGNVIIQISRLFIK